MAIVRVNEGTAPAPTGNTNAPAPQTQAPAPAEPQKTVYLSQNPKKETETFQGMHVTCDVFHIFLLTAAYGRYVRLHPSAVLLSDQ